MDFQNRAGNKVGGGGVASFSQQNVDRRERLCRLAKETLDLSKDPYFFRNNVGSYECRLCLTIHTNEGSYLAHSQGKKHQTNLAKRQLKDKHLQMKQSTNMTNNSNPVQMYPINEVAAISRPGYRVTKMKDSSTYQKSIMFEIEYPYITNGVIPRDRTESGIT